MKVKRALILAAGQGTRMGEIGKVLPKVMWPIYNKTMLELQVLYLREMGIDNIYINLHCQKDFILKECQSIDTFKEVRFLIEKELLGVGGAIHNLARQPEVNYNGDLLVINADQFCFFESSLWEQAYQRLKDHHCSLFATQVHSKHKYNEIILDEKNNLSKIETKKDKKDGFHLTYGGFGFINLERLHLIEGRSDFFKTIAPYKQYKIPMTVLPKNFEYWDFGTKERFYYQMLKLKGNKSYTFLKFLKRNGVRIPNYFYMESLDHKVSLCLDKKFEGTLSESYIIYHNILEEIKLNESLL